MQSVHRHRSRRARDSDYNRAPYHRFPRETHARRKSDETDRVRQSQVIVAGKTRTRLAGVRRGGSCRGAAERSDGWSEKPQSRKPGLRMESPSPVARRGQGAPSTFRQCNDESDNPTNLARHEAGCVCRRRRCATNNGHGAGAQPAFDASPNACEPSKFPQPRTRNRAAERPAAVAVLICAQIRPIFRRRFQIRR